MKCSFVFPWISNGNIQLIKFQYVIYFPVFIDQGFLFIEYILRTVKNTGKTPHTVNYSEMVAIQVNLQFQVQEMLQTSPLIGLYSSSHTGFLGQTKQPVIPKGFLASVLFFTLFPTPRYNHMSKFNPFSEALLKKLVSNETLLFSPLHNSVPYQTMS